jgi:hypothetical protein
MRIVPTVFALLLIIAQTGCTARPSAVGALYKPIPSGVFRMFPAGTYFMLAQPLTYQIGNTNARITVPAGFVTDLASIPPVFQGLLSLTGPYSVPAVIHDYLYWDQGCTKDEADQIFLWAMMEARVPPTDRARVHLGVRTPGIADAAFLRNATDRAQGMPRIIPPAHQVLPPLAAWPTYRAHLKNQNVKPDPGNSVPQSVCAMGRRNTPPPGVR